MSNQTATLDPAVEAIQLLVNPGLDRRRHPRFKLEQNIHVRPAPGQGVEFDDVRVTLNVSQTGLYFLTSETRYAVGMKVEVEYPPAAKGAQKQKATAGEVVRIVQLGENTIGVAVHLGE